MTQGELKEVWRIKTELEKKREEYEAIEDAIQHITPSYSGQPKSANKDSRLEKLVVRKTDLAKKIQELDERLFQQANKLFNEIWDSELNLIEKKVLVYRYVDCLKFEEIAEKMKYTRQHIYRSHRSGKEKFCVLDL